MRYIHVHVLLLMSVFYTSCGQNQTKDNVKSNRGGYSEAQLKEADSSKVPMSMVRNVKQARNGDILIASYLGVFRYDPRRAVPKGAVGTPFTNLTSKISSPRFSSFWDVLEDRKGNLWFASQDSGVYCYNPRLAIGKSLPTGQAGFQHFTTKDGLASNEVLHIYEDRAGNIWFGANRYDGNSFRNFTTKDGFPTNNIRLLLEDKTGKLWFGAQGENMFVYDGKTFTVLKNEEGKAFNNVSSIIEDKKGNIWFGADGLWRYDGLTFTKVSQSGAYAIIEDKNGNIWTTGEVKPNGDWALSRYDQKSLYNKNPTVTEIMSVKQGCLCGILEDNDGNIWFGVLGPRGGVYRYDGKTITDFRRNEGH